MSESTSILVFAGPSLRRADCEYLSNRATALGRRLDIHRPIRRHDLINSIDPSIKSRMIMLDGEFGQSLAVSVAEVRAALFCGQTISGASSMGALRAVECRTIGMSGSGWVYEQYLSGKITSDAEVALLYDPDDYLPVTIPLVNLRWLLSELAKDERLSEEESLISLRIAGGIHFRDRRHSLLLKLWKGRISESAITVLEERFEPDCRDDWDRKRMDAIDAVSNALN
ncbi:TfuA-like protein [Actinomadura sp. LOL_016]|uniref:TfuA-like protein n=1 Tax=unclassified Actinomadura TaxID=2626254 RepID=UPI003A810F91